MWLSHDCRFDRLVYLDVSEDSGLKEKILRAITRKLNLEEGLDLSDLALRCPTHTTGADLYALCSSATVSALRREIQRLEDEGKATTSIDWIIDYIHVQEGRFLGWVVHWKNQEHCVCRFSSLLGESYSIFFSFSGLRDEDWGGQLVVTMEDFNSALETLQLSISAAELAKYKELHLSLTQTNTHSTSTAYWNIPSGCYAIFNYIFNYIITNTITIIIRLRLQLQFHGENFCGSMHSR